GKGATMSASFVETVRIDMLLPANHAEAVNGLLYLTGGGWTDLHRRIVGGQAPPSHFGVALSVRVPWNATNAPHTFVVDVQNEDATTVIVHVTGEINVGRPPQITPGAVQHAVIAINVDTLFPAPGGYRIIATLDGGVDSATWPFQVHDTHSTGIGSLP
ncbi:MAG: DUF6941 family protein, partial [Ktedonobacterales bacterium]